MTSDTWVSDINGWCIPNGNKNCPQKNKLAFDTKNAARRYFKVTVKACGKKKYQKQVPYLCSCGFWHLTTSRASNKN